MKRTIAILSALILILLMGALSEGYEPVYSAQNPIPDIAERVRPAVVQVLNVRESWDPVTRIANKTDVGSGSGCYIRKDEDGDGGYILTNYHIVQDADSIHILWLSGEDMQAKLVGYDDGTDIAILRFEESAPLGVDVIPLGDSDALRIGELAICIGYPGVGKNTLPGSVTAGIVSGIGRDDVNANNFSRNVSVIQIDAAINVGNSGGAMLNSKGELVGLPTLKYMADYSSIYESLGFCVPINTVRGFIDQIIDTGSVIRPRLGITVANIDGPDEPLNKYPPIGAQVYTVEENGPSDKVGIQVGDVITEINGIRINGYMDLLKELDKLESGDIAELKVYRYAMKDGAILGGYEEFIFKVQLELLKVVD